MLSCCFLLEDAFCCVVSTLAHRQNATKLVPLLVSLELAQEYIGYVECTLLVGLAVLGHGVELGSKEVNLAEIVGIWEHAKHTVLEVVGDAKLFHCGTALKCSVLQFTHGVGKDELL